MATICVSMELTFHSSPHPDLSIHKPQHLAPIIIQHLRNSLAWCTALIFTLPTNSLVFAWPILRPTIHPQTDGRTLTNLDRKMTISNWTKRTKRSTSFSPSANRLARRLRETGQLPATITPSNAVVTAQYAKHRGHLTTQAVDHEGE